LITLRAMVIPETLPDFLDWLNLKGGRNPDQNQTVSLDFQCKIRDLFPQEKLADGMKFILPRLLAKKITPDTAYWLLLGKGSAWFKIKNTFIDNIQYDLQLICNLAQTSTRQPPFPVANFKFDKQIWQALIKNTQSSRVNSLKIDIYKPLAELFGKLKQYPLAAYFYQVSDGVVPKDIFYEVAQLANTRENTIPFLGLSLYQKITPVETVLGFINNNKAYVSILSGLIIIVGLLIATILQLLPEYFKDLKIIGNNRKHTTISPEEISKDNQNLDGSNNTGQISKDKKEKALNKFDTTSGAIKQLVDNLTKSFEPEGIEEKRIKEALKNVLNNYVNPKNIELNYSGAIEDAYKKQGKPEEARKAKTAWVEAIYNYQKSKNTKNAYGFMDAPGASSGAQTYKDLKQDVENYLYMEDETRK
ncbi:MAG: hypothetical protein WBA39_15685, partial [Rivularia sp. (in: cyanobacteria)]